MASYYFLTESPSSLETTISVVGSASNSSKFQLKISLALSSCEKCWAIRALAKRSSFFSVCLEKMS